MRIAQVAPLIEPVPPRLYGGTERVVSYLTEELVRRGHEVTLFASGDSKTLARLESVTEHSIRLNPDGIDPVAFHMMELSQAFSSDANFDIIHCHLDFLAFPFAHSSGNPAVHTLHGRLDLPHWGRIMARYADTPLVSISDAQRRPLENLDVNWAATVYHGMPEECFRYSDGNGDYLAFFSRISREKRPDLAVEVAKKAGIKLKVAGKVDPADRTYFEEEIEPLFDHPLIEFVGELGTTDRLDFLGAAKALLFPIDWPEPFGLVVIEALACGTPVITRRCGSMPEIVRNGRVGYIVDTVDEMVDALRRIDRIDRKTCFAYAQERFSAETMARRYEAVYEAIISQR